VQGFWAAAPESPKTRIHALHIIAVVLKCA
jgi:hypothetical protein